MRALSWLKAAVVLPRILLAFGAMEALTIGSAPVVQAAPPGTAMKLQILSNRLNGQYDYLTEAGFGANYPYGSGCYAYVPFDPLSNTLPFYRLFNGSDHMDSPLAGEGAYTTEGVLGYPFTSASPFPGARGLVPLERWYREGGWHGTTSQGHPLGLGFVREGPWPAAYGYARQPGHWSTFNNVQVTDGVWSTTSNQLSAAGITIAANPNWGGQLVKWEWNGIQFINNYDAGRQIQVGLFVSQNNVTDWSLYPGYIRRAVDPTSYFLAPTSGGDGQRNGSPCITLTNDTRNPSSPSQTSECLPLEFFGENYGGDENHPVVYRDMPVGRTVTLNCQPDGVDRNWPVAEFVSRVTLPNPVSGVAIQAPYAALRAAFRNFWKYDPGTDRQPVRVYPVPQYQGAQKVAFYVNTDLMVDPVDGITPLPANRSGYGGLIVADSADPATNNAFGIFAVGEGARKADGSSAGGTIDQLNVWDKSFTNPPDAGEFSLDTVEIEAGASGDLPAGTTAVKTYVMSGTVNDIQRYMDTLYAIERGFDITPYSEARFDSYGINIGTSGPQAILPNNGLTGLIGDAPAYGGINQEYRTVWQFRLNNLGIAPGDVASATVNWTPSVIWGGNTLAIDQVVSDFTTWNTIPMYGGALSTIATGLSNINPPSSPGIDITSVFKTALANATVNSGLALRFHVAGNAGDYMAGVINNVSINIQVTKGPPTVAPTNLVISLVNSAGVNTVTLTGSGGSGPYGYSVQSSTDLADWTTIATGQGFGPGGTVNFTQALANPLPSKMFYRISVPE